MFLDFFKSKGHKILPSSSLIPDDPQLLFTVAGMVPFKKIFWGLEKPKYSRVATVQKCLRTNDIENVGRTPRHQTMFEMLGNFSFGDYYKKEAIEYAWEFLTEWLKIPRERLWVSIYEKDDEAYDVWTKDIGLEPKKIVRMGKEDNFWGPVGPSGPCGPDSEIFYDTLLDVKECPNPNECDPSCDCDRFLEVWNLVFTGLYQDENGNLGELERKNIDTGMGLERITAVMQNVESVFDTDLFVPFIKECEKLFEKEYGKIEKQDVSMRVIADHSRASAFLIADGVFPSNTERGYVLRRLIRRAVRHGKLLGKDEPFLYKFVDVVKDVMGEFYPEIQERYDLIKETIKAEEERFFNTLDQGLSLIDKIASNSPTISSEEAFKLYDTYGIPLDITVEIAKEKGAKVEVDGFNALMEEQRERARSKRGDKSFISGAYEAFANLKSDFIGYEHLTSEAKVIAIVSNGESVSQLKVGEKGEVIFDRTPFYAEKGGQIGDSGTCEWNDGRGEIHNTYFKGSLHLHEVEVKEGVLKTGTHTTLKVDELRRKDIARNHTATHLLHAALRKVLGEHVKQAGSLVSFDKLRFDFTHMKSLSKAEIKKVEEIVNSVILEAIPVKTDIMSLQQAKESGAMALFNEKYSDEVRVVSVGDFSKELCGGTHVENTGNIGSFIILEEKAVSAGVRRIEAISGRNTLKFVDDLRKEVESISEVLDVPLNSLEPKVKALVKENEALNTQLTQMKEKSLIQTLQSALKGAKDSNDKVFVFDAQDADNSQARNLADMALNSLKEGVVVVIFSPKEEKSSFVVKSSGEIKANEIAKKIATAFGGKGGGRPNMAQGGWNRRVEPKEVKEVLKSI
jgi:alanyl-tRNA synthetase